MCGRYASFQQNQDLLDSFLIDPTLALDEGVAAWRASWNIAPTDRVRMVVARPDARAGAERAVPAVRSLRAARWGLVPGWAKGPEVGARLINARAESVAQKRSFAPAFGRRRCLLPANGFYEWCSVAGSRSKVPYFIHADDDASLAFAGLYEFWRDPSRDAGDPARWLTTCTIITTAAHGELAQIHDRRPLILAQQHWDAWLDPHLGAAGAAPLLTVPAPSLSWHRVATTVNSVAQNGPRLIEPVTV